ncbi:MAG: hypothetical protein ACLSB9_36915 [Hydrogeniiclostridium mannosilyticum]
MDIQSVWGEAKFEIETFQNVNDDCNSSWVLYPNEESYLEEKRRQEKLQAIREYFRTGPGRSPAIVNGVYELIQWRWRWMRIKINDDFGIHSGFFLNLKPGYTPLVGPNGAGKTTLLRQLREYANGHDIMVFDYSNLVHGGGNAMDKYLWSGNMELLAIFDH